MSKMITVEDIESIILRLRAGTIESLDKKMDNVIHEVKSLAERVSEVEVHVKSLSDTVESDLQVHKILENTNDTLRDIHRATRLEEHNTQDARMENILSELKNLKGEPKQSPKTSTDLLQNKFFWYAVLVVIFFLGAGSGAMENIVKLFTGGIK